MEAPNGIIIFHYPFSPYARRVIRYLQLRGLAYAECVRLPSVRPLPHPYLHAPTERVKMCCARCLMSIPER